jgi:hypothetical protein
LRDQGNRSQSLKPSGATAKWQQALAGVSAGVSGSISGSSLAAVGQNKMSSIARSISLSEIGKQFSQQAGKYGRGGSGI